MKCPGCVIEKSSFLQSLLEVCQEGDDVVPLQEISEKIMKYIIIFCEFYSGKADPVKI